MFYVLVWGFSSGLFAQLYSTLTIVVNSKEGKERFGVVILFQVQPSFVSCVNYPHSADSVLTHKFNSS